MQRTSSFPGYGGIEPPLTFSVKKPYATRGWDFDSTGENTVKGTATGILSPQGTGLLYLLGFALGKLYSAIGKLLLIVSGTPEVIMEDLCLPIGPLLFSAIRCDTNNDHIR
ncbi:hypothetical protein V6N12_034358 [Hibiscus sabdariffa]|uniref:Uncharacterized protein n=1 Tax=Hibiscus sabdariffa TaxID=183260 RepID=A0ABR2A532_9ROSI